MYRRTWPLMLLVGVMIALVAFAALRDQKAGAAERDVVKPIAHSPGGELVPVVVELFTSEGCSSCPPADHLLARLQQEQPVPGAMIVTLGEHVDYWNRLGWADRYSSPEFSSRQQSYAAFFGIGGPYTPQMVVDGREQFVGSDHARALEAVWRASRFSKAAVHIERNQDIAASDPESIPLLIRIEAVNPAKAQGPADVWLAITEDGLESAVDRGENAGRHLQHVAVVRQMHVLGRVDFRKTETCAAAPTITLAPEWRRENLRAVVFAQERRSRRILAAGALDL